MRKRIQSKNADDCDCGREKELFPFRLLARSHPETPGGRGNGQGSVLEELNVVDSHRVAHRIHDRGRRIVEVEEPDPGQAPL